LAGAAGLAAVGELLDAHPRRFVAAGIHQHHVGQMQRCLALDDAALPQLLGRLLVLLHEIEPLHHHAALRGHHPQDPAALAALPARDDHHGVALPHVRLRHRVPQMTSGASEMILVNCLSRSSRATGPKMRVPTGLSSALRSTTALRSKRMYEPSFRPTSFTVRTTTARATSPFFTVPSGTASLTATITMSPREAVRLLDPPITRMHCAFLAPELSATSSIVLGWIMSASGHASQDFPDPPALVLGNGPDR